MNEGTRTDSRESSSDPISVARSICLSELTRGPQTRWQLAEKLRKRLVPADAAEHALDRLTAVGLVDDAAFARAWVDTRRVGRGLSSRALSRELQDRGVAEDLVEAALADVTLDDEADAARDIARRRLRSLVDQPVETRVRRTVALLGRRGYPPGLAYRVVRKELEALPGDEL